MTYCGARVRLRGLGVADREELLPAGHPLTPLGVVAAAAGVDVGVDGLDEVGEHGAAVADDRHVGLAVLADLGRVDVGVDDLGLGREGLQLAGDPVVEAGAQGDDQVALLQAGDRRDRAVHARHPEVQRVAVGQRAAGHQRGDDGDLAQLDEAPQLLARAGPDDAAADVEDRALGLGDQPGGLADLLAVRAGDRVVAGQVDARRPGEPGARLQGVLGDVDEHRAGAAGGGDVERLGDDPRDLVGVGHEVVVLGDRHRDAADVGLLEGVGADGGRVHLTGDGDDRHRVHVGVGERGDQVGRARARGGHADADPAGRGGVALGRVAGALLVADQDVAHLDRVEQRVVGRQDRAAGDAEDGVDVHRLEREHQALRAGHLDRRAGPRLLRHLRRARGVRGHWDDRGHRLGLAHCCHRLLWVNRCSRPSSVHKKTLQSRGGTTEGARLV